jgi:hypothetical protein
MFVKGAAPLIALVLLTACSKDPPKEAAGSVQGFLTAAANGDAAGFEAAVDRPAVRADLRRQLVAVAQAAGVEVDGGPSDPALDRMIVPEAVRQVEAAAGGPAPEAATAAELAPFLKKLSGDRVCLHDDTAEQACLLTFARQKAAKGRPAAWRLVGMQAPDQGAGSEP